MTIPSSKDKSRTCVRCGCEGDASYCGECGAPLINRCTSLGGLLGEPCGHENGKTAAFCTKCGSHTAFYQAGLLQSPYPENKVLETDEVAEMDAFISPFFEG